MTLTLQAGSESGVLRGEAAILVQSGQVCGLVVYDTDTADWK